MPATHRSLFRPAAHLALAACLLGVPLATASAGAAAFAPTQRGVPLENRYCDSDSGYDCTYAGYPPDYQFAGSGGAEGRHRY
ncbi:MAG TPA: hypothetical protein VHV82_18250 [Sporichthyaceae bacterium]|jgi:hypothetical protein|nr:hypothetical protein [Sporichthyaceae bacterium]